MQAVILAGGKGTRLHPLTTNVPKPMVPLFDKPVMEHCINLLIKHGITDIIITVSYLANEIMQYFGDGSRWGVKIRYSVESEPLGTAGGVKLVQDMINERFVVVSGDAVTDLDLSEAIDRHVSASAVASMLLYKVDDPSQFGLVQHDSRGKITRFLEKPKSSEVFTNTVNTGIYILEPEVLSCIPYHEQYDFARQLFPRMLNNQDPIYGFSLDGYWCDVGNLIQYRNAHFDALTGKVDINLPACQVENNMWIGERVQIDPSVEISGPIFLGDGVTIRNGAKLDKCSVIGSNTLIDENAHISRSVIGCNSRVGKFSEIQDSIIGSNYSIIDNDNITDMTIVESGQYDMSHIGKPSVAKGTIQKETLQQKTEELKLEKVAA